MISSGYDPRKLSPDFLDYIPRIHIFTMRMTLPKNWVPENFHSVSFPHEHDFSILAICPIFWTHFSVRTSSVSLSSQPPFFASDWNPPAGPAAGRCKRWDDLRIQPFHIHQIRNHWSLVHAVYSCLFLFCVQHGTILQQDLLDGIVIV